MLRSDSPALPPHSPPNRKRDTDKAVPAREYDDILAACRDVKRAALGGATGSGKSTTLRKLKLARAALTNPKPRSRFLHPRQLDRPTGNGSGARVERLLFFTSCR